MSSVAVRYYIERYTPASLETTFTWTTNTRTQTLHWDPKFFATVSKFYENMSQMEEPWTTFKINHRNTIKNDNAAHLFHNLIPTSPGWDKYDRQLPKNLIEDAETLELTFDDDNRKINYTINDIYCALELCDFLCIEANDYIVKDIFIATAGDSRRFNLQFVITYHQMFLHTHYKRGIEACENRFNEMYSLSGSIRSLPGYTHSDYLNESYSCKIKAYVDFAKHISFLPTTHKTFLKEIMLWKDQMEIFGVLITL